MSYLVGERGPEFSLLARTAKCLTNGVLGKLDDAGKAVSEGAGDPVAPSPERIASARPDAAASAQGGGYRSFHAGSHTHNWHIKSDQPHAIRAEVESIFGELMRQMTSDQSGLLSD